jgi:hypothetical protein
MGPIIYQVNQKTDKISELIFLTFAHIIMAPDAELIPLCQQSAQG